MHFITSLFKGVSAITLKGKGIKNAKLGDL